MMRVKVYEWLRGDGNAWIDTNYIPQIGDEFSWHCVFPDDAQKFERMFSVEEIGYYDLFELHWAGANLPGFSYTPSGGGEYLQKLYNTLDIEDSAIVLHQGNRTLWVFTGNDWRNNIPTYKGITTGKIAYLKIKDKLFLRPCKLLASYQNHPAGECAMIDVLSNTLYFNQGSGSFSVEGEAGEIINTTPCYNNIISKESKVAVRLREWLVGGYRCRIDTGISYNVYTDALYMSFRDNYGKNRTSKLNSEGKEEYIFGAIKDINSSFQNGFRAYFSGSHSLGIPLGKGLLTWTNFWVSTKNNENYNIRIGNVIGNSYRISGDCDGESVDKYFNAEGEIDEIYPNISIFGSNVSMSNWANVSFKSFKIERNGATILDLHPAELALPYDNHPIGECCMIDLNSGDLYFNQGSGQFSCEGAFLGYWQDKPMVNHYCDVEGTLHKSVQIFADNGKRLALIWERKLPWTTHRWLTCTEGDSNAPTIMYDFPLPFRMRNLSQGRNNNILLTNNYSLFYSGSGYSLRYNYVTYNNNSAEIGVHDIALLTDGIEIDGNKQAYPTNVIPNKVTRLFHNFNMPINIGEIITDTFHLSPAILNRPTLPSEDNNNIARKQGEAVFVDEERYRRGLPWCFGNVASSGSFSVSDYLIEGEDYQRIEGVRGDGLAWINTGIAFDASKKMDMSFCIDNDSQSKGYVLGAREYINRRGVAIFAPSERLDNTLRIDLLSSDAYFKYIKYQSKLCVASIEGSKIALNGVEYNYSEAVSSNEEIYLFAINSAEPNYTYYGGIVDILSFTIDGVINLIPIRLKRTIEPTCTHNGKGGKVGEIGFFDTISGRFYGNDGRGEFMEYIP